MSQLTIKIQLLTVNMVGIFSVETFTKIIINNNTTFRYFCGTWKERVKSPVLLAIMERVRSPVLLAITPPLMHQISTGSHVSASSSAYKSTCTSQFWLSNVYIWNTQQRITGASHRFYKNITILACSARVASSTRTFEAVDSIPASSPVATWIACAFVDIWNAIIGLGTYLLISCAFVVAQERQQKKK